MYLLIAAAVLQMVLGQSPNCPNLNLDVVYEWKTLRYAIPSNYYINSSLYQEDYSLLSAVVVGPDYFLLSTPNSFTISPYTISSVPKSGPKNDAPLLQPFPDISWYMERYGGNIDCKKSLISVFEMEKDRCNRLWVVDTGLTYDLTNPQQICPPKIVVFDLNTKKAVKIVPVSDSVLSSGSRLENLVLDSSLLHNGNTCDNAYAYIADSGDPGIVVYSSREDRFHRITHQSMNPEPGYNKVTVDGETYEIQGGILGMALLNSGPQRRLYYQPYPSVQVFSISASSLQIGSVRNSSELGVNHEFTKSYQSVELYADRLTGCLLFNPTADNTIVAWNNATKAQREVAHDPQLIYVIEDINQENITSSVFYAISSREPKFVNKNLNPSEINQRLIRLQAKP